MADLPPPPPSAQRPPAFPPVPPPPGASGGYGAAPPYGLGPTLSRPDGLRKATIVLFWCATAAAAFLAVAAINRKVVWESDSSFSDLEQADQAVGAAAALQIGLVIASAIVLSLWSYRTANNAQEEGALGLSPGLACGGWYIPFGWFVVPFIQLRRVAIGRRRRTSLVTAWQVLFIVQALFGGAANQAVGLDEATFDEVSGELTVQVVVTVVSAVLYAATTIAAMRAVKDVDAV